MTRPACEGCDTDYWFSTVPAERNLALSICNGTDDAPECPVKAQCLELALRTEGLGAITRDSVRGVFGGLTARQRMPLIVSLCPRCHGPRPLRHMYCAACSDAARQETRERDNNRKRINRESRAA